MKIDVVTPTWNSNGPYFRQVILSLLKNVPLCHLIIIDRYSSDGTVDVIRSLVPGEQLRIIKSNENLAWARKIGIGQVDTEWFAFIDSDIKLCERWFEKMWPYTRIVENVGAVQAIHWQSHASTRFDFLRKRETVKIHEVFFKGLFSLTRGLTTQTLIKKDAVKGWNPPRELAAFEDYHLTQHILHRGYKFIVVNDVISQHIISPSKGDSSFRWGLWCGAGVRITGAADLKTLIIQTSARMIGAIRRRSLDTLKAQIGYLIGYIDYRRYTVLERRPLIRTKRPYRKSK